jgi:glucosyl-dolichyl phosphate glucuronosyltransferase
MKITVVICTYQRSESLAKALSSLSVQVLPNSVEWEVLVVDNNSSDTTREVAQLFCHQHPARFRYTFEPKQGKSHALNRAVREARGEIVAFTDDDVIVEPTWLQNLTASLQGGEWTGVGGRTLPEQGFVPPRWLALENRYALAPLAIFDKGLTRCELKEPPFGNNMAYRKWVIEKYGGFRADLGPRAGSSMPQKSEDSEFGNRLLAAGERFCYEPNAIVYHCVPRERIEKEYFLEWWFDKARSDIQAFGIPDPRWCVAGIPLRLFRRLAVWILRWMTAIESSRRFDSKLKVWTLIGQIQECYRWRLGTNQQKGCNAAT